MGFTVRFMLGIVLVLLSSWSTQTIGLQRHIRQISTNGGNKTADKLHKVETETTTQHTVTNLSAENNKEPKTDSSTEDKTLDKQNSVVDKLQSPENVKTATTQPEVKNNREEIGRSIDIEKYVSKEFHNKNNVYTLPVSSDTEKYINPDYDFHHDQKHEDHSQAYNFDSELTTPKSSIFDHKFKEAVESVDQKLEHIDDSHEISEEAESKENISLEKLHDETKKNDTKADLDYISYKNIISNDTGTKNSLHKDLVVEAGTNLNFRSNYNHTSVIDEDDNGNNTIAKEPIDEKKLDTSTLSNIIPFQGDLADLENAESSASKHIVSTTKKSIILTKPPSNKNSSHISILSNKIETETVKAFNPLPTTERPKEEKEVVVQLANEETPLDLSKRFSVPVEVTPSVPNEINKTSEQLLQENQVIPIHIVKPQPPTTEKSPEIVQTTETDVVTVTAIPGTTDFPESTVEVTTQATTMSLIKDETTTNVPLIPDETTPIVQIQDEVVTSSEAITTTQTETETRTSIVTETSTTPWEKMTTETQTVPITKLGSEGTTVKPETLTTTEATVNNEPTTMSPLTYQASNTETVTTKPDVTEATTFIEESTIEAVSTTPLVTDTDSPSDVDKTTIVTTESPIRTSKGLSFKPEVVTVPAVVVTTTEITTTELTTTELFDLQRSTEALIRTTTDEFTETTMTKNNEQETTTSIVYYNVNLTNLVPEVKIADTTEPTSDVETTTGNNTITSDFYEHPDSPDDNSGTIAAITISSIGAVCLILVAGLLVIMRKRQKRFNYGQRCTPVSLDDYSMDNVSVYNNSVRRKGMIRSSKRSYGNPAFEDPVSVSHPLNFPALGKFSNNLEDIKAEFEDIPQITARMNELPEGCDTKNRYANVIPLPETRVFLSPIDGYPNSDYINANYVTGPKNTKGYYIACQAPMQNTVDDFWRMIWEQQCKVVLMLTHLFENGVEKCIDYLPPSEVLDCHRLFGDFQVTLKKREVKDKYIISSLQLKNMVSNSWREVTHFWYLGWPEKGVPTEANSLIAFLIEARSYMKSASLDRKDVTNGNLTNGVTKNEVNPVVVHCSPGTGRTGVVIACDIAIREFEQTRLVDVPRIVYRIRRDRASAVQTKEQYAYIYKVINLYATKLTGGALDSL